MGTAENIIESVRKSVEDHKIPRIVADYLRERDGRRIDRRDVEAICDRIRADTGAYFASGALRPSTSGTYTALKLWVRQTPALDTQELVLDLYGAAKNVKADLAYFLTENRCYFSAADKRNAERCAIVDDADNSEASPPYVSIGNRLGAAVDAFNTAARALAALVRETETPTSLGEARDAVCKEMDLAALAWIPGLDLRGVR